MKFDDLAVGFWSIGRKEVSNWPEEAASADLESLRRGHFFGYSLPPIIPYHTIPYDNHGSVENGSISPIFLFPFIFQGPFSEKKIRYQVMIRHFFVVFRYSRMENSVKSDDSILMLQVMDPKPLG